MSVDTMKRLFELKNIAGVKDATAKLDRVSLQRQVLGEDFVQLSGEDATALGFNAQGGVGCISVVSNVAPRLCAELQNASLAGDYAKALRIQDRLFPLQTTLFLETNPSPVKYALARLGLMTEDVRLPLLPVGEETRRAVDASLAHAGLIAA